MLLVKVECLVVPDATPVALELESTANLLDKYLAV